jgi:hypothetical protein
LLLLRIVTLFGDFCAGAHPERRAGAISARRRGVPAVFVDSMEPDYSSISTA